MEDRIKALSKTAGINVELLWPGLFTKTLANVNIRSPFCNIGAGGPAPTAGASAPSATLPQLRGRKWRQIKKTLGSLVMTWALTF